MAVVSSNKKKAKGEKEVKVFRGDLVEIEGTGASKFLPKGFVPDPIHRIAGEKLVAAGKAKILRTIKEAPIRSFNGKAEV